MLDEILTLAMSHIQLITAALMAAAVLLELIHIGQTRRINKRLHKAGLWLQRYLNTVLSDDTYEESKAEETDSAAEARVYDEDEAQLSAEQSVKSRQEENMRVALAHKKTKKDEELLDTVLQEIFD